MIEHDVNYIYTITPACMEVMELILKGYDNPEIADKLCKTVHTVKNQLNHLYRISGIHHSYMGKSYRVKLVIWFLKNKNNIRVANQSGRVKGKKNGQKD